jgi:mono/diheme cytochrome c family protein
MISKFKTSIALFPFLFFTFCGPKTGENGFLSLNIKFNQYYINGKKLYAEHCSNCHQKDGSGLVRLYPPIEDSDYLKSDPERTICIIRNGLKGEIFVNGISFNQPMPMNINLTNLEIAELVTFLYSTWGDMDKMFNPTDVADILKKCPKQEIE